MDGQVTETGGSAKLVTAWWAVLFSAARLAALPAVLDALTSEVAGRETDDDIVLLAVRIPGRAS